MQDAWTAVSSKTDLCEYLKVFFNLNEALRFLFCKDLLTDFSHRMYNSGFLNKIYVHYLKSWVE